MDKISPEEQQRAWAEIQATLSTIDLSGITPSEFWVCVRYLCGATSAKDVGRQLHKTRRTVDSQMMHARFVTEAETTILLLAALVLALSGANATPTLPTDAQ